MPSTPHDFPNRVTFQSAINICTSNDTRLPNIDELSAMIVNMQFINLDNHYWSSTLVTKQTAWYAVPYYGMRFEHTKNVSWNVRCIKR